MTQKSMNFKSVIFPITTDLILGMFLVILRSVVSPWMAFIMDMDLLFTLVVHWTKSYSSANYIF
jgi:ABC-type transport system involved in cytochrome bd biosynthesis fused ATPase/permease subunit